MKRPRPWPDKIPTKMVPFTVIAPPLTPGQKPWRRQIMIRVTDDELEVLTIDACRAIDTLKLQMMVGRLYDAVRELTHKKKRKRK